jgi:ABC-type antimicrobial peptide transport system permease subunit
VIYFEEALRVIFANKVRSLLTVTGLIIGVGAVIAIQVLGNSMSGAIAGTLGNLSDNSFIIFPGSTQSNYERAMVTRSDITELSAMPNVAQAVPMVGASDLLRHGHEQARYYINGDPVEPFNNVPLAMGRRFTAEEVDSSANICVLSDRAYHRLFPHGGNPLGQSVYAGVHRYLIVGVTAPPRNGLLNLQFGGNVSVPYTTILRQYIRGERVGAARIIVKDVSSLSLTEVAAIKELRALHGNQRLEYSTFDKAQLTQGINQVFGAMTLVVAFIGAVSLLVAGIGIMNIMLVSVTERTREIGVRKAIGATRTQVLAQFFIEALLLCGIGCSIGLALGLAIGWSVNTFAIVKLTGYTAPLPWVASAILTILFTAVVTIAFGTYPAYRAAALDPIEALRYE